MAAIWVESNSPTCQFLFGINFAQPQLWHSTIMMYMVRRDQSCWRASCSDQRIFVVCWYRGKAPPTQKQLFNNINYIWWESLSSNPKPKHAFDGKTRPVLYPRAPCSFSIERFVHLAAVIELKVGSFIQNQLLRDETNFIYIIFCKKIVILSIIY